jgi:hypothetical protein
MIMEIPLLELNFLTKLFLVTFEVLMAVRMMKIQTVCFSEMLVSTCEST